MWQSFIVTVWGFEGYHAQSAACIHAQASTATHRHQREDISDLAISWYGIFTEHNHNSNFIKGQGSSICRFVDLLQLLKHASCPSFNEATAVITLIPYHITPHSDEPLQYQCLTWWTHRPSSAKIESLLAANSATTAWPSFVTTITVEHLSTSSPNCHTYLSFCSNTCTRLFALSVTHTSLSGATQVCSGHLNWTGPSDFPWHAICNNDTQLAVSSWKCVKLHLVYISWLICPLLHPQRTGNNSLVWTCSSL